MNEKESELSFQRYLLLSSIIIILFVLVFFTTNLEYFVRKKSDALYNERYSNLKQVKSSNIIKEDKKLLIEGKNLKNIKDLEILKKYIDEKKPIVFLNMPGEEYIRKYNLENILGIGNIKGKTRQEELNLVPGFILGGFHEIKDLSYEILNIDLLSSTKVYGFGEDNRPVIWRNTYEESEIYIINGPFMETNAYDGILSALMAQIYGDYIYPIVNARLMIYEGFPYINYENKEELEKLYNRDAMKFQHDILLPDILGINKRREFIPNGYMDLRFKDEYKTMINNYSKKQFKIANLQISKSGGEIGLRYSGDIEYDKKIFKYHELKSILIDESIKDTQKILGISNSLKSVVGPWKRENNFNYLDENIVYMPLTLSGVKNNGQEKLDFISGVTAFGAIVQNLNIEDIVLFQGENENWTDTSKDYVEFIDEYRKKFNFLESRNITKASDAVKIFRNNSPIIKINEDHIKIRFDEWYGESYYILRTHKEIDNIINGKFEKIEKGSYLITVMDKDVDINLSEPKNKNARR